MKKEPEGLKYNSPGQRLGLRDKVSQWRNQSRVWKTIETMRHKFNKLVFEKTTARLGVFIQSLMSTAIEFTSHKGFSSIL